jgi:four helix bundle protein
MDSTELRERTMRFAVRAVKFCRTLSNAWESRRIGGQLIDASTSVAMNYRATRRARSRAEFISKLGTVVEEADECVGWLELIARLELATGSELAWLTGEANELLAIFAKSQKTAKANHQRPAARRPLDSSIDRRSPHRRSSITEDSP